jgi:uncharacterized membrane protein
VSQRVFRIAGGPIEPLSSVALPPLPADLEYCVVARRNDSLGRAVRWQVFGALAAASLLVAISFAFAGAWPVLAYSSLEIAALGGAFLYCERRAGDWERLIVAGDEVIVEQAAGGERQRHAFNRYWLRVEVETAGLARTPRVTLVSGRARQEFGSALPAAERLAMAKELRQLTGVK